jgi:hypothetical protein
MEYGRTKTAILIRAPYGMLDEKSFMDFTSKKK